MEPRASRIERLLSRRNARITLAVLAVLTVGFTLALRDVRLDHDFEKFFPTDDPELDRYEVFRQRFGNDNDMLLIGASHRPSVFDSGFLKKMDELSKRLDTVPNILSVSIPTRMDDPRVTPVGVFRVPWLRPDGDDTLEIDSARIWQDDRIRDTYFALDAGAMLMVVQTGPGLSKERSDALMVAVEREVAASGLPDVRMGGRIHGQYWYIKKMQRELIVSFSLSVGLLALFLAIGFRTAWGVLVPIGVVGLAVLWQVAMITLLGEALSILTMLVPTILFVVGMSDVVHILERYIEALRNGHPKARALAISYHEVGLATFLTSLTTAIGFGTLISSSIEPIRQFGLFTAVGVFIAFVLSFTLLPSVLLLVRTPVQARRTERSSTWYPVLHSLFRKVIRLRRVIPWGFAALVLVCLGAISQLKVDNYLLEDWPDDDPQLKEYHWFEEHFGGVRPFEMEIVVKDGGAVWDLEHLRDIERVQTYLKEEYGIQAVLSPVTVIKALNKAFNGGAEAFHVLPEDEADAARLSKRAELILGRKQLQRMVGSDGQHARMSGRMVDRGGHLHGELNKGLEEFIATNTRTGSIAFDQTGMAYLIDRSNARLSGQLIGGLSVAFLIIAGIMAFVFRDLRMTLIALVPNVIPLLFVGGTMGVLGIDIKVSTAIIFTIAFGIAVDDTIHMLGKLRIELLKGRSLPYAMKRAFLSAGKALLVTSIMLLSGFISLVFSDFASVHYMGLLVSLTLAMALLADLVLLPVLVMTFLRTDRVPVELSSRVANTP